MPRGEWETHWPEFEAKLKARLDAGFKEYGDESFTRTLPALVEEIEQEVLDLAGWSLVLYGRLQRIRHTIALAGEIAADEGDPGE